MDEKSNAVLQKTMDEGQAVRHERDVKNAALEDAAIVCEVFADVNQDAVEKYSKVYRRAEAEAHATRVTLCRKIAETIRARKDFGPKPLNKN